MPIFLFLIVFLKNHSKINKVEGNKPYPENFKRIAHYANDLFIT